MAIQWGIRQVFSALPDETLKPLYNYGLIWCGRAALREICALPPNETTENVQRVYQKARTTLSALSTKCSHNPMPPIAPFVAGLGFHGASVIKENAEKLSLALEKVMQEGFPQISLMETISTHLLDQATSVVIKTKEQISGKVQATLESMNPPLKGLSILEPFKTATPAPVVTPKMVKQKVEDMRAWSTAFISMKCVNAIFDFREENPLQFLQQIDRAGGHGSIYKWAAKKLYNLVHMLFAAPLKRLMDRIHTAFTAWLQKDTESRGLDVLHWLEEWLSSMSESYSRVASTGQWGGKRVVDLLDENIRAQLPGKKQVDLKQLCSALVYAGLNLCSVEWTHSVEKSCWPWPVKKVIKLCLYLPEWLFNAFLRTIGHFILMRWVNLPALIDTALKAQPINAPLSSEILEMKEWGFQKIGVIVNHVDERLKNPGEKISDKIQRDMHACLQVLLEVLHKSNYPTVEKLQHYLQMNLTLKDKMLRELEEAALPVAMPVVALSLGSALEKALEAPELLATVYDLLSMCDKSFKPRPLVHPSTDTIDALIDALLEKTACYELKMELPQRIAMTQATGFVSAIKLAFAERAYLRSLMYQAMTTSLALCNATSQPQPT